MSLPFTPFLKAVPLVSAEDFRSAFAAAGVPATASDEELNAIAWTASCAAWHVVATQYNPSIPDIRKRSDRFEQMRNHAMKLTDILATIFSKPISAANNYDYMNYLSALEADPNVGDPTKKAGEQIRCLDEIIEYADSVLRQAKNVAERERKTRTDPEGRSPARNLGLPLFATTSN